MSWFTGRSYSNVCFCHKLDPASCEQWFPLPVLVPRKFAVKQAAYLNGRALRSQKLKFNNDNNKITISCPFHVVRDRACFKPCCLFHARSEQWSIIWACHRKPGQFRYMSQEPTSLSLPTPLEPQSDSQPGCYGCSTHGRPENQCYEKGHRAIIELLLEPNWVLQNDRTSTIQRGAEISENV